MLAKCFSVIRNYVLSIFFAKNVHYLPPKHASRTNFHNIIGRNPLMMIHLLANQDLTPMLVPVESHLEWFHLEIEVIVHSIWENLSEH